MRRLAALTCIVVLPLVLLVATEPALTPSHERPRGGESVHVDERTRAGLGVRTAAIGTRSFASTVVANGRVTVPWDGRAYATSRVAGRVVDIAVGPFEVVEEGQVLALLESGEVEDLGLELAQATLRRAYLEQVLARERTLAERGITARKELQALETQLAQAASVESTTTSKLVAVGLDRATIESRLRAHEPLRTLPVRAPRRGTVVHVDVELGELVPPTKHLFDVRDFSTVWVEADVLERDSQLVAPGQDAVVRTAAGTFTGHVVHLGSRADERAHAIRAYVAIANPERVLKENLPASVEIATARVTAPALPRRALLRRGLEDVALVEEPTGVVRPRVLRLGPTAGDHVAVLEGLAPGDRVVVSGQHELAALFPHRLSVSPGECAAGGVRIEEVRRAPLDRTVHLLGTARVPHRRAGVATARTDAKVARLIAQPGERVGRGQVLAELESLELETEELDLLQADLEVALARRELERVRPLAASGVEPRALVHKRENDVFAAEARFNSLERKLHVIGLDEEEIERVLATREPIRRLSVRAPLAGIVSPPLVVNGQVVAPGHELYAISETSTIWIEGAAVPADAVKIERGQRARVRLAALPGEVLEGTVVHVGAGLDESSLALPVFVAVANDDARIRPNQQATLDVIVGETEPVPCVPRSAIIAQGTSHVAIVRSGGAFHRVKLETGRSDDRSIEVPGLAPGEHVVTEGAEALRAALLSGER